VKPVAIRDGIYAAQIRALYQHLPMVLIVDVVNSALVSFVLASYLGHTLWLAFLTFAVGLAGARAVGWYRYHHHLTSLRATTKWAISATIGSGLSGLLWGAGSALLLSDNLVEQTFVAFVIGGMSIASLVAFSNYLPAFIAYVFPASLPLAGRLFLDGWTVHGDMMVVFAAAITLAAYNATRGFANGLQLNLDLMEKSDLLAAANGRLEIEIEQRRASEDQLRQAHKMEAVGQLTGGIAHDFNNLLTAIIGRLEMAEHRVSDDPRTTALVQAALRAAERGAALTRHLLAFGRRQQLEPRSVEIPGLIDGAAEILKQTIGPEIQLVVRSQPDLQPARADPNQLELAILKSCPERAGRHARWRRLAHRGRKPARCEQLVAARAFIARLRGRVSVRHGYRDEPEDLAARFRALLYHQGGRARIWVGIINCARLRSPVRRIGSYHERSGERHQG